MTEFDVHTLSNKGIEKSVTIQAQFKTLVDKVKPFITDDRCRAIMMTKLEEACFYAKKGMAMDKQNQPREGL